MKRILQFGLVLSLIGCAAPDIYTPAPTPGAINIVYPSTLQPWAEMLANCGSNNPQIALYFMQSTNLDPDIRPNDIMLELGQTTQDNADSYLYQIGWEQVVVIVNKDNQLSQISNDDLRAIISGQVSKWEGGSGQPIQVWVLPEGEPTRTVYDNFVMSAQPLTTEAMLAPDPGVMLEVISKDADAIGYLPGSFLSRGDSSFVSKVKILQVEPSLEAELRQPVIAIVQSEPKGLLRNLLVCLQGFTP
jgi:phosphate transport system substrate-binding protein